MIINFIVGGAEVHKDVEKKEDVNDVSEGAPPVSLVTRESKEKRTYCAGYYDESTIIQQY